MIKIKSSNEFKNALKSVKPGDEIVVQNGMYRDLLLWIPAGINGIKEKPILLRPESPEGVLLNEKSSIHVCSDFWTVSGFHFRRAEQAVWIDNASFVKLSELKMEQTGCLRWEGEACDPASSIGRSLQVTGHSENVEITKSEFIEWYGVAIYVSQVKPELEGTRDDKGALLRNSKNLLIQGNRFSNPPYPPLRTNGGEAIMLGLGYTGQKDDALNSRVEENLFENVNSDSEIVSVKSSSNLIRKNEFRDCKGHLSIRLGNFNVIEENTLVGTNHGIRVSGASNLIQRNHLEPKPGTAAFMLIHGSRDGETDLYWTAKGNVFTQNEVRGTDIIVDLRKGAGSLFGKAEKNVFLGNRFLTYDPKKKWISTDGVMTVEEFLSQNVFDTGQGYD
ncbi:MAG: chondroitinase-B domain-containing protein [Candidatus Competibacteraceae bacterium]